MASYQIGGRNRYAVLPAEYAPDGRFDRIDWSTQIELSEMTNNEAERLREESDVIVALSDFPGHRIDAFESAEDEDGEIEESWALHAVEVSDTWVGEGVSIGIIDTGIDSEHDAFRHCTSIVEKDFTNRSATSAQDSVGHGTHCAGLAFGGDVAGVRIGVAPNVDKAAVAKVFDGDGAFVAVDLYDAVRWMATEEIDIISMSLGWNLVRLFEGLKEQGLHERQAMAKTMHEYREVLRAFDAILEGLDANRNAGPLVVAAAGNESNRKDPPGYTVRQSPPAASDSVLGIGALDMNGALDVASFSNSHPYICAPGVNVRSAWLNQGTQVKSGTSMAAPIVAGVAAAWWGCMRAQGVDAGPANVIDAVVTAADPMNGALRSDIGHGLVRCPP